MAIVFKATNEQVMQIGANATNASKPVGMGFIQFDASKKFEPDFFSEWVEQHMEMSLDYVGGRMVKIFIKLIGSETWRIPNPSVNSEYQSWSYKYRNYEELLASAGITEIEKE